MKNHRLIQLLLALALSVLSAAAQAPGIISHQGKVTVAGTNYTGAASFKFALVNAAGDTSYWSNDGTSAGGSQPTAAVSLDVARGVFSVNLGETNLANMTQAIPASAFSTDAVYLRVWFNDGVNGSQLLAPDRRITSVAYALKAASAASYTETDPVFGASAAAGIAGSDITAWNAKVSGTRSISTTAPLAGGGDLSANRTLSLAQATGSADGYLASADWTAFNGKESVLSFSGPLSRSVNTISLPAASDSADGYLSSANWTTFNNKVSAARSISTTAPLAGGGDLSANRALSMAQATGSADGYLASADWTTFNGKESVLSFSGPLSRSVNTISLPAATSSANGYLASADWTAFNGKESVLSFSGPLSRSVNTISLPAATSSANGYLSSANWTTFNSKVGGSGTVSYVPVFTAAGTIGDSAIMSDASTNVGIGTTSPVAKLDVRGGAIVTKSGLSNTSSRPAVGSSRIAGEVGGLGEYGPSNDGFLRLSAGGGTAANTKSYIDLSGYSTVADMNQNLVFGTGGTEVMRITAAGKVGIGTATPSNHAEVFSALTTTPTELGVFNSFVGQNLSGADYEISTIKLGNRSSNGLGYSGYSSVSAKIPNGSWSDGVRLDFSTPRTSNDNTQNTRMSILPFSGYVGIGTTAPAYTLHVNGSVAGTSAYNNLSDARLKKDVQPIGDALAIVAALRGVTFNWDPSVDPAMKLDDRNHVGFLAQEVEAVLPQAVSTASDARQTKSVAYSEVIPVLTEAIKQQQGQIGALKAENDALKARLAAIEAKLSR